MSRQGGLLNDALLPATAGFLRRTPDRVTESKQIHDGIIIVLAGGQNQDGTPATESVMRCQAAAMLYRSGCFRKIVVTGGASNGNQAGRSLARAMAECLAAAGADASSIVVEDNSMSTRGSAQACARLLHGDRGPFVLVTSARHVVRASWTFRRSGLRVRPFSAETLAGSSSFSYGQAALEFVKLCYYFARGWICFRSRPI